MKHLQTTDEALARKLLLKITPDQLPSMFFALGLDHSKMLAGSEAANKYDRKNSLIGSMLTAFLITAITCYLCRNEARLLFEAGFPRMGFGFAAIVAALLLGGVLFLPTVWYDRLVIKRLLKRARLIDRDVLLTVHAEMICHCLGKIEYRGISDKSTYDLLSFGEALGEIPKDLLGTVYAKATSWYWTLVQRACRHYQGTLDQVEYSPEGRRRARHAAINAIHGIVETWKDRADILDAIDPHLKFYETYLELLSYAKAGRSRT